MEKFKYIDDGEVEEIKNNLNSYPDVFPELEEFKK